MSETKSPEIVVNGGIGCGIATVAVCAFFAFCLWLCTGSIGCHHLWGF